MATRSYNAYSFSIVEPVQVSLVCSSAKQNVCRKTDKISALEGLVFTFMLIFEEQVRSKASAILRNKDAFIVRNDAQLIFFTYYSRNSWLIPEFGKIYGLLKTNYVTLAGYALVFRKRVFLRGKMYRIPFLFRRKILLKIGFPVLLRVRGLRFVRFYQHFTSRKRKDPMAIRMRSNNFDKFSAFIELLCQLRYRGRYTGRGFRKHKDRFKLSRRVGQTGRFGSGGSYGFR